MALSSPVRAPSAPRLRRPADIRPLPVEFPSWPLAILAVPILVRAAIFSIALVVEPWSADPGRIIPVWAQILQASCFGALAFVLLRYGRDDRRAWSLGLFILDAATTLLTPFVRAIDAPSAIVQVGLHLRTDAFQAALIWFFAGVFPRSSLDARTARLFRDGTAVAFILGMVLTAADAFAQLSGTQTGPLALLIQALQRESPGDSDWYFTLQFLVVTPLAVLLPYKLRECGPNDRRRFTWLVLGIGAGFTPLFADVMLITLSPEYAALSSQPPYLAVKATLIVLALTVVPVAGAYAALVQRTLEVRLVLRRAVQYLLAQSFIRLLAAAPFAVLVALVVSNRDRSISDLVTGPRGLALGALTATGFAAALGRQKLLAGLDRQFFRQQANSKLTLLGATDAVRQSGSLDDLRETLASAVDAAFHPESIVTAIVGSDNNLHPIDADLRSLPQSSALAQILSANDMPLELAAANLQIIERLGANDREWLRSARAAMLVPLRSSREELVGVLVLGEQQSELPYSAEDRILLAAVGTSAGLALDRILSAAKDAERGTGTVGMDPPARECIECGILFDADAISCSCGGLLQRAPVPHVLGDRLRFVQRIGAGGMGVVYRAVDLRLQKLRAVKTLPSTDPALISRLRREARAMAAVQHQNLATIHGLEEWQRAPMLVMEFLEGGTLFDRLKRGAMLTEQALDLSINIANGLAVLHAIGLLHRDIKPSNIAFTVSGVPKLLDFGLAKTARGTVTSMSSPDTEDSTWSGSVQSDIGALRGTPPYLSPEVLGGAEPSASDDFWSLSVTLLEACTGTNPYRGVTVAATVVKILTSHDRVLDALRQTHPTLAPLFGVLLGPKEHRPHDAEQFVWVVREFSTKEA